MRVGVDQLETEKTPTETVMSLGLRPKTALTATLFHHPQVSLPTRIMPIGMSIGIVEPGDEHDDQAYGDSDRVGYRVRQVELAQHIPEDRRDKLEDHHGQQQDSNPLPQGFQRAADHCRRAQNQDREVDPLRSGRREELPRTAKGPKRNFVWWKP